MLTAWRQRSAPRPCTDMGAGPCGRSTVPIHTCGTCDPNAHTSGFHTSGRIRCGTGIAAACRGLQGPAPLQRRPTACSSGAPQGAAHVNGSCVGSCLHHILAFASSWEVSGLQPSPMPAGAAAQQPPRRTKKESKCQSQPGQSATANSNAQWEDVTSKLGWRRGAVVIDGTNPGG